MSYHKDKLKKRLQTATASAEEYEACDQESVRFELAVLLLTQAKDSLAEFENNIHGLKPELAEQLAQRTRDHIPRLERIIAAYQSGESILTMSVV